MQKLADKRGGVIRTGKKKTAIQQQNKTKKTHTQMFLKTVLATQPVLFGDYVLRGGKTIIVQEWFCISFLWRLYNLPLFPTEYRSQLSFELYRNHKCRALLVQPDSLSSTRNSFSLLISVLSAMRTMVKQWRDLYACLLFQRFLVRTEAWC